WDGTSWQIVSANAETFNGIAAVSPTDVWGVGFDTKHWDGTSWRVVPAPSPNGGELDAVWALSSRNVWAVGVRNLGGGSLTEHWNGTTWTVVKSPDEPQGPNPLASVSGTKADNVWAVGVRASSVRRPLSKHWNGTAWKIVPTEYPASGKGWFSGVSAAAVGSA